jgi:hypothetical protein
LLQNAIAIPRFRHRPSQLFGHARERHGGAAAIVGELLDLW